MSRRSMLLSSTIAIAFAAALVTIPASAHPGGGAPHAFTAPPQVTHVIANASASTTRHANESASASAHGGGSTPNPAGARPIKPAGEGPSRGTSAGASPRNTGPTSTPQTAGARPTKPTGEAPSRGTATAGQSSSQSSRPSASNVPLHVPSVSGVAAAREVYAGNLTAHLNTPLHSAPTPAGGKTTSQPNGPGTAANPETPANGTPGKAPANGTSAPQSSAAGTAPAPITQAGGDG